MRTKADSRPPPSLSMHYRADGAPEDWLPLLAVAWIYRDLASLRAELAMEQQAVP